MTMRAHVATWATATMVIALAAGCSADSDAVDTGETDSTTAEAPQDAEQAALPETDVVGADIPDDFPADRVPLADGAVNIGVTDMGSGDVYTAVIAGDGVVEAQIAALEGAGWEVDSEHLSENSANGATSTTVYYVGDGEWTVDLYGFDANYTAEGSPEQVSVNVWPSAYDN